MAHDPKYTVKPLGHEDRAAFQCGDPELDSYFHERASRDMREKLSAVFILVREDEPGVILGYYTLSAQQIDAGELPQELKKRTGRYTRLGVTLLGRLAVAKRHHGEQLGAFLLVDALRRSLSATKNVMSFAVVVDAKSDAAVNFYRKFGFVPLSGKRLMLAMKTIEKNFQPANGGNH